MLFLYDLFKYLKFLLETRYSSVLSFYKFLYEICWSHFAVIDEGRNLMLEQYIGSLPFQWILKGIEKNYSDFFIFHKMYLKLSCKPITIPFVPIYENTDEMN